jgi:hypothetical protein
MKTLKGHNICEKNNIIYDTNMLLLRGRQMHNKDAGGTQKGHLPIASYFASPFHKKIEKIITKGDDTI